MMARGAATFRQSDMTRMLKAAKAAGLDVVRCEVDATTGKITIMTGFGRASDDTKRSEGSDLDEWMKRHED